MLIGYQKHIFLKDGTSLYTNLNTYAIQQQINIETEISICINEDRERYTIKSFFDTIFHENSR